MVKEQTAPVRAEANDEDAWTEGAKEIPKAIS